MANNYTGLSMALPNSANKEASDFLEFMLMEQNDDKDHPLYMERDALMQLVAGHSYEDYGIVPGDYFVDATDEWIYIYSESDEADVEYLCQVLQEYLKRYDPDGYAAFEFASYCSKPRTNEFGGGACFITALGCDWMNTSTWLGARIQQHKEGHG